MLNFLYPVILWCSIPSAPVAAFSGTEENGRTGPAVLPESVRTVCQVPFFLRPRGRELRPNTRLPLDIAADRGLLILRNGSPGNHRVDRGAQVLTGHGNPVPGSAGVELSR